MKEMIKESLRYELTFSIQGLPKIITNGPQGSWRLSAGERKKWKRLVCLETLSDRPLTPLKAAHCTFIRISSTQPDDDNLRASFKSVRDGLVQAGILEDDKPVNMPEPKYLWIKGSPRRGYITVKVSAI